MQQQHHQSGPGEAPHVYTATEVARYEYCPLVWWHEQFDPLAIGETEDLFAQMVEMEYAHGPQATSLPDYQVIEQILVQRGAFEKERSTAVGATAEDELYIEQIAAEELTMEEEEIEGGMRISQKMLRMRTLAFAALGGGVFLLFLSIAYGFVFSH
jgi:hypothetical protein